MSIYYKVFREYRGLSHSPAIVAENPRTALEAWVLEHGSRGKVWMVRMDANKDREIQMARRYDYPTALFQRMAQVGL